ncbi:MAG: hypothetical protein A2070_11310 [Bdellovibrionales bacterium GWC1_52_8]|nr:MAG: hypothetical protein A2X97_00580 [Bdellovibrionales bacterium GWA1_52_35]OFZ40583.1 MAG: hypothetical protein A2070_11310 [Bdellovibrionales bacterium GWC1_52_8]
MKAIPLSRMSRRSEFLLTAALGFYAVCSLVSMAAMSISAFLVLVAVFYHARVQAGSHGNGLWHELREACAQNSGKMFFRASLALAATLLLSLLAARVFPSLYEGHALRLQFWRTSSKLWYLFWPLLLWVGLKNLSTSNRRAVLQCWIWAFVLLSLIGIVQYFTGWPRPQVIPGNEPYFHTTLFLGHHLSVASIFIFPFFAVLDLARKPAGLLGRGLSRGVLIIAVGLGVVALLGTYSRMLWVALPIGLLLWSLLSLPRKWAIMASILVVLGVGLVLQHPKIQSRVQASMGVGDRQALWNANLEFFKNRPLTGTGWRMNEEASAYFLEARTPLGAPVFSGHAHSNVLDLLGGTGALGTLAWVGWWWVIFIILGKALHSPSGLKFPVGLLCAFVVFHINGLTQVNFWEAKVQHQLAFMIAWLLLWATPIDDSISPGKTL